MGHEERRRFIRYEPPEAVTAIATFPARGDVTVHVRNLSVDGLSFETETNIAGESFVTVSMKLESADAPPLRINSSAQVIWHIYDEKARLHTVGARFLELDEAEKESLRNIISSWKPQN